MRLVALGFELAHESGHALVDQGLDLGFGDVGELQPQDVAGLRDDGGKVAQEEDGMENAYARTRPNKDLSILAIPPGPRLN